MSELSPEAEARDMELTTMRIWGQPQQAFSRSENGSVATLALLALITLHSIFPLLILQFK